MDGAVSTAIRRRRIGWSLPSANSKAKIRQGRRIFAAQGIEAEILVCPEGVHKIGAESPVFCGGAAKNAP
jgi:hypothetical protein